MRLLIIFMLAAASLPAQNLKFKVKQLPKDTSVGRVVLSSLTDSTMTYSDLLKIDNDSLYFKGSGVLTSAMNVGTGTVDLAADVTGTLPIANGGTGSATQNFVDLSSAQNVGGAKTFTSDIVVQNEETNTNAAELTLYKETGSGFAGDVTLGDSIGSINFNAKNGSTTVTSASIEAVATSLSNNEIGGDMVFKTASKVNDRPLTEAMRIDKLGNISLDSTLFVDATNNRVGINTNNPQYRMDFSYTGATGNGHFQNGLIISNDDPNYNVLALGLNSKTKNANIGFLLNGTIRAAMTYDTRGFFGIINSVYNGNDFSFRLNDDGSLEYYDVPSTSTSFKIEADGGIFAPRLGSGSAAQSVYYNTGTDEIFYVSSSIRYKENVEDLPIGLNDLLKLRPATYKYKSNGNKDYGFIAEEVYDAGLEEFVTFNEDGQIEGLKDNYFTVLSIKAIQEQQTIIENLQAQIDELKQLINK